MVTAIFLALWVQAAVGVNLLTPPGTPSTSCKWNPWDGKATSEAGEYEIPGSPYGENGTIEGFTILFPPMERHLIFSLKVKAGRAGQKFSFSAVGYDTSRAKTEPWTSWWNDSIALKTSDWTTFRRDMCIPKGTDRFRVIFHNPNQDSFLVTNMQLVTGEPGTTDPTAIDLAKENIEVWRQLRDKAKPSPAQLGAVLAARSTGMVVNHVHIRGPVRTSKAGEVGIATFPVPALDCGQVPIAFKVACDKPGKILSANWRKRGDGRNYLCDVKLVPGTHGVWLQYDALVLSPSRLNRDTQPPEESGSSHKSKWTRGTACVQTDNSDLKAVALKLSSPMDSEESYARKVFTFARDCNGKGAPFKTLDAAASLECGGSCTNRANLAAALLRLHGIPARTVSHMPTWGTGKFYEHWLTEYWQPGAGWIAVDPLLGRWDPDRRSRVVLATSSEQDEDRSFEPLHTRMVMPGAPYASSLELSPTLYQADLTDTDAINESEKVARFFVGPSTETQMLAAAHQFFKSLFRKLENGESTSADYDRIFKASASGRLGQFKALLKLEHKS
jgi:hypothetical protein